MITPHVMADELQEARARLNAVGQSHVLAFYDELGPAAQRELIDQIEQIDFREFSALIGTHVKSKPTTDLPADIQPATCYPNHAKLGEKGETYRTAGLELLRAGKVAAFTVAGGQGTRLGWNGPKGSYPATPVMGKPLFRVFAEQIRAAQTKFSVTIPWYIMTSPINDADTRAFFQDNNYFGLTRKNVFMFPQGVMPSLELGTGNMLLAERGKIAVNPDGHGGSLRALCTSGAVEDMRARGIEHVSYFQVDNPLVRVFDAVFLGLHAVASDSSGEMSSKMVPKASAEEKVGVFCSVDNRTMVIEYSDLPRELAQQREAQGELRFNAGNIAIHLLSVAFVERLSAQSDHFALPFHRAEKAVPYVDVNTGKHVTPETPNAVKLETFVFDAIPLAAKSIVYETSRIDEFAPIKNADGDDSPATSHQLQSQRSARWLEANGVKIPWDNEGRAQASIEISPLTALEADDLKSVSLPKEIHPRERVVL
jgi:UDP-N-acetylglucosamine/UDP-N-acetylgalactosamine diphosphorylase